MAEKVGRNDLCPCGSGLKYKRCHALKEAEDQDASVWKRYPEWIIFGGLSLCAVILLGALVGKLQTSEELNAARNRANQGAAAQPSAEPASTGNTDRAPAAPAGGTVPAAVTSSTGDVPIITGEFPPGAVAGPGMVNIIPAPDGAETGPEGAPAPDAAPAGGGAQ